MIEIQLTNSDICALIDDADLGNVSPFNWQLHPQGYITTGRNFKNTGSLSARGSIKMHRYLLNAPQGFQVDHINHCKWDNQRHNLRLVTQSQNNMNRAKTWSGSSRFKGVYWHVGGRKWCAYISTPKRIHLGLYKDEEGAARAYNLAATQYFGEFACLNPI